MDETKTATVTRIVKLRNSRNGNPRYRISLEAPRATWNLPTQTDAGWVYAITESWQGKRVRFTVRNFRITSMELES